jgi:creatinine amidohydrolase
MTGKRYWSDLTTEEFKNLDPERVVTILPVAATEQHGPHLPVATDTAICESLIRLTLDRLPDDLQVLVLPTQPIGKSNEHLRSPGTLTYSAETVLRIWTEVGECVHRAGLRKMVIVNSHGGNSELMGIVARELRVRLGMLVVTTAWMRFGVPDGLYGEIEMAHGIHAGDVETSLMLHLRPDLVDMERAAHFVPRSVAMENEFALLRPTGPHAFAWIAQDVHPSGAIGDASLGAAEKGCRTAEHQVAGFIDLLRDVSRFSIDRLWPGETRRG